MNTAAIADPRPQTFREVWLISAGHGLTHWYTATFYLLLPLIGKELGLSYTEIGVIMTVQHLAGAISNLPGGMLVDTVGKKGYLMATSLFWVGFPYALMSLTHNFWMLLVCVTLVGIGNNLWHPAAIPTLAYRYPQRKGLVLSFHGMGGNLGEGLAPVVVGAMLAWFSWRTVVVINVVPGFVMAAMILLMLGALTMARTREDGSINAAAGSWNARQYLRDFVSLLRNKGLMLVSCSSAFRTMTQVGLLTFLPVYLAYELGYSPFVVGICLTVLQVAGFIAAPIAGHLSDKLGRKRVVISSMLLTGVMIVAMALAGKSSCSWSSSRWSVFSSTPCARFCRHGRWRAPRNTCRHRRGIAVRHPGRRRQHRAHGLRHDCRRLRHLYGLLFPRRHHHFRQPAGVFHAERRVEQAKPAVAA